MKINEYLDAAKAALRCRTDSELALRLECSNRMARLIAAILGMRTGALINDIRKERALRRTRRVA